MRRLASEFDGGCRLDGDTARLKDGMPAGYSLNRCKTLKSVYETASIVSIAGFAGAAVFIGVGVALWLTEPAPAEDTQTARWICAPAFGGGNQTSVGCAVRF